jgi:hypothetical protein
MPLSVPSVPFYAAGIFISIMILHVFIMIIIIVGKGLRQQDQKSLTNPPPTGSENEIVYES